MERLLNKVTTGNMIELSKEIPDSSIDCIFTDPPYPKEFWYLYDELSKVAGRVLKPGGICFCYTGNYELLPYAMNALSANLKYRGIIALRHIRQNFVWHPRYISCWKPILVYHRGRWPDDAPIIFNEFKADKYDTENKRYHEWGQGTQEAMFYLSNHTKPNSVIFDPFCGGGTTAVVVKRLGGGRQFITFEIDPRYADIARERLGDTKEGGYEEQLEMPGFEQLALI